MSPWQVSHEYNPQGCWWAFEAGRSGDTWFLVVALYRHVWHFEHHGPRNLSILDDERRMTASS